jgi:hypothetical protein
VATGTDRQAELRELLRQINILGRQLGGEYYSMTEQLNQRTGYTPPKSGSEVARENMERRARGGGELSAPFEPGDPEMVPPPNMGSSPSGSQLASTTREGQNARTAARAPSPMGIVKGVGKFQGHVLEGGVEAALGTLNPMELMQGLVGLGAENTTPRRLERSYEQFQKGGLGGNARGLWNLGMSTLGPVAAISDIGAGLGNAVIEGHKAGTEAARNDVGPDKNRLSSPYYLEELLGSFPLADGFKRQMDLVSEIDWKDPGQILDGMKAVAKAGGAALTLPLAVAQGTAMLAAGSRGAMAVPTFRAAGLTADAAMAGTARAMLEPVGGLLGRRGQIALSKIFEEGYTKRDASGELLDNKKRAEAGALALMDKPKMGWSLRRDKFRENVEKAHKEASANQAEYTGRFSSNLSKAASVDDIIDYLHGQIDLMKKTKNTAGPSGTAGMEAILTVLDEVEGLKKLHGGKPTVGSLNELAKAWDKEIKASRSRAATEGNADVLTQTEFWKQQIIDGDPTSGYSGLRSQLREIDPTLGANKAELSNLIQAVEAIESNFKRNFAKPTGELGALSYISHFIQRKAVFQLLAGGGAAVAFGMGSVPIAAALGSMAGLSFISRLLKTPFVRNARGQAMARLGKSLTSGDVGQILRAIEQGVESDAAIRKAVLHVVEQEKLWVKDLIDNGNLSPEAMKVAQSILNTKSGRITTKGQKQWMKDIYETLKNKNSQTQTPGAGAAPSSGAAPMGPTPMGPTSPTSPTSPTPSGPTPMSPSGTGGAAPAYTGLTPTRSSALPHNSTLRRRAELLSSSGDIQQVLDAAEVAVREGALTPESIVRVMGLDEVAADRVFEHLRRVGVIDGAGRTAMSPQEWASLRTAATTSVPSRDLFAGTPSGEKSQRLLTTSRPEAQPYRLEDGSIEWLTIEEARELFGNQRGTPLEGQNPKTLPRDQQMDLSANEYSDIYGEPMPAELFSDKLQKIKDARTADEIVAAVDDAVDTIERVVRDPAEIEAALAEIEKILEFETPAGGLKPISEMSDPAAAAEKWWERPRPTPAEQPRVTRGSAQSLQHDQTNLNYRGEVYSTNAPDMSSSNYVPGQKAMRRQMGVVEPVDGVESNIRPFSGEIGGFKLGDVIQHEEFGLGVVAGVTMDQPGNMMLRVRKTAAPKGDAAPGNPTVIRADHPDDFEWVKSPKAHQKSAMEHQPRKLASETNDSAKFVDATELEPGGEVLSVVIKFSEEGDGVRYGKQYLLVPVEGVDTIPAKGSARTFRGKEKVSKDTSWSPDDKLGVMEGKGWVNAEDAIPEPTVQSTGWKPRNFDQSVDGPSTDLGVGRRGKEKGDVARGRYHSNAAEDIDPSYLRSITDGETPGASPVTHGAVWFKEPDFSRVKHSAARSELTPEQVARMDKIIERNTGKPTTRAERQAKRRESIRAQMKELVRQGDLPDVKPAKLGPGTEARLPFTKHGFATFTHMGKKRGGSITKITKHVTPGGEKYKVYHVDGKSNRFKVNEDAIESIYTDTDNQIMKIYRESVEEIEDQAGGYSGGTHKTKSGKTVTDTEFIIVTNTRPKAVKSTPGAKKDDIAKGTSAGKDPEAGRPKAEHEVPDADLPYRMRYDSIRGEHVSYDPKSPTQIIARAATKEQLRQRTNVKLGFSGKKQGAPTLEPKRDPGPTGTNQWVSVRMGDSLGSVTAARVVVLPESGAKGARSIVDFRRGPDGKPVNRAVLEVTDPKTKQVTRFFAERQPNGVYAKSKPSKLDEAMLAALEGKSTGDLLPKLTAKQREALEGIRKKARKAEKEAEAARKQALDTRSEKARKAETDAKAEKAAKARKAEAEAKALADKKAKADAEAQASAAAKTAAADTADGQTPTGTPESAAGEPGGGGETKAKGKKQVTAPTGPRPAADIPETPVKPDANGKYPEGATHVETPKGGVRSGDTVKVKTKKGETIELRFTRALKNGQLQGLTDKNRSQIFSASQIDEITPGSAAPAPAPAPASGAGTTSTPTPETGAGTGTAGTAGTAGKPTTGSTITVNGPKGPVTGKLSEISTSNGKTWYEVTYEDGGVKGRMVVDEDSITHLEGKPYKAAEGAGTDGDSTGTGTGTPFSARTPIPVRKDDLITYERPDGARVKMRVLSINIDTGDIIVLDGTSKSKITPKNYGQIVERNGQPIKKAGTAPETADAGKKADDATEAPERAVGEDDVEGAVEDLIAGKGTKIVTKKKATSRKKMDAKSITEAISDNPEVAGDISYFKQAKTHYELRRRFAERGWEFSRATGEVPNGFIISSDKYGVQTTLPKGSLEFETFVGNTEAYKSRAGKLGTIEHQFTTDLKAKDAGQFKELEGGSGWAFDGFDIEINRATGAASAKFRGKNLGALGVADIESVQDLHDLLRYAREAKKDYKIPYFEETIVKILKRLADEKPEGLPASNVRGHLQDIGMIDPGTEWKFFANLEELGTENLVIGTTKDGSPSIRLKEVKKHQKSEIELESEKAKKAEKEAKEAVKAKKSEGKGKGKGKQSTNTPEPGSDPKSADAGKKTPEELIEEAKSDRTPKNPSSSARSGNFDTVESSIKYFKDSYSKPKAPLGQTRLEEAGGYKIGQKVKSTSGEGHIINIVKYKNGDVVTTVFYSKGNFDMVNVKDFPK